MFKLKYSVRQFSLISFLLLVASLAGAQSLSDAEIQQAIDMMRASGQSEAQIEQFLKAVKMVESMPQVGAAAAARGGGKGGQLDAQTKDIQSVTGFSDQEMQIVGPIAEQIKQEQDKQIAAKLEQEIAAFEQRYAGKPEVFATFDDQRIRMRLVSCDLREAYAFHAQAAPSEHNKPGTTVGASRGWSVKNNSWAAGVGIRINGQSYRTDISAEPLAGSTFQYQGVVVSEDEPTREIPFSFAARCTE